MERGGDMSKEGSQNKLAYSQKVAALPGKKNA